MEILKSVSGYAIPGETLYIMGSSGAGKTSLLNMMSDRIKKRHDNHLDGKIMLNDTVQMS